MIYLDHNASTPPDPRALEASFQAARTLWGNAASAHQAGRAARRAVETAREALAHLIGASPSEIVFTSGGTEANALALLGFAPKKARPLRLATSRLEHPSLLSAAEAFARTRGEIFWADTPHALEPHKADLISVMLAQNETGEIFDVARLAREAHAHGALVHCDAVQAIGKIDVKVDALGVDLLSLSGHKFGAPPGTGALYVRRKTPLQALFGGVEEGGRRGGTLNVPGIVGLGVAARLAEEERLPKAPQIAQRRDALVAAVLRLIPGSRETAADKPRLPNTAHLLLPPPCDGEELITRLDASGICVSTGAACASGQKRPSHVLLAMGLSAEEARGSLRISLGPETNEEEIARFLAALPEAYQAAREAAC